MEPEGSIPNSQELSTCSFPEPNQSSPHPPSPSPRSIQTLSTHLCLGLPSSLFPSGFPTNNLYTFLIYPICASCPAYLILLYMSILIILCEEYKSWSSLLCIFLHPAITSSLLAPNVHLRTLFSNTLSQTNVYLYGLYCMFHLNTF
jgi:hypothetical protein